MKKRCAPAWRAAALGLCWTVSAWCVGAPGEAHAATILTFDQVRDAGGTVVPTVGGFAVPQDYGDRVTGSTMDVPGGQFTYGGLGEGFTPRVQVEYFGGTAAPNNPAVSLWQDGYGDLVNVLFGNQFSGTLNVLLTADPGFSVLLYDFDLGGWFSSDYTIAGVRVLYGSDVLLSESNVLVQGDFTGPRHTSFAFGIPISGSQLLIEIDYGNLAGTHRTTSASTTFGSGRRPCQMRSRFRFRNRPLCCCSPVGWPSPPLGTADADRSRGTGQRVERRHCFMTPCEPA